MTFRPAFATALTRTALGAVLSVSILAPSHAMADSLGYAVVPTQIIYPGEEIDSKRLQTVEVTNKNLSGGYARDVSEVKGLVTTRTLLPGRTIMVSALRQPYTVKRGDKVLLVYDNDGLRITASGTPLADGVVGELIQARNTDTGVILSGTVMPDRTVLVVQK
ncbi:MAG: flagella basal body P-ring formation protein FlgA [Rhizobium sp.]|nr:flagella basal body P-ring formation protein FlgA [Rhizobium sp.]